MSDEKKDNSVQPTAYVGTVKVTVRDKDHFVHISTPPMGATIEELEKALQKNRDMINKCQDDFKNAFIAQVYEFKPPMQVNFDSPTQNAIMAHLNINILIPLINVRGGNASFEKAETFHVKQRLEIMRNVAERVGHMERMQDHGSPVESAVVIVGLLVVAMSVLLLV